VVIDTPARPESDDLKELSKGCDLLILPTKPDIVSLEPMLEMRPIEIARSLPAAVSPSCYDDSRRSGSSGFGVS